VYSGISCFLLFNKFSRHTGFRVADLCVVVLRGVIVENWTSDLQGLLEAQFLLFYLCGVFFFASVDDRLSRLLHERPLFLDPPAGIP
jgi:hypothetical protein